jgi:hypothetical protein
VCHTHSLTSFSGPSGSFQAPDHEYPSHLLLTLTVTDSGGLTATRTIQLDPKTVDLSFASAPGGATVTVNGDDHVAPYTETFIQGSRLTITAAPTHGSATFSSWSDGGARSHELSAPTLPTTYTATYLSAPTPVAVAMFTVLTRPGRLLVEVDHVRRAGGWSTDLAVGTRVRLVAPRQQVKKGVRWVFVRWSDGGARKHDVTVPGPGLVVRAVYRRAR